MNIFLCKLDSKKNKNNKISKSEARPTLLYALNLTSNIIYMNRVKIKSLFFGCSMKIIQLLLFPIFASFGLKNDTQL
jgi:hypothetical protein